VRAELETKLQDALGTIDELRGQLDRVQRERQEPIRADDGKEINGKHNDLSQVIETLRDDLKQREGDVARLTNQLSQVSYAHFRLKQAANKPSMSSTISAGAIAFVFAAFIPTDAVVMRFVDLLQSSSI